MKKLKIGWLACIVLVVIACGPDLDLVQAVLLPPSKVDLVFPEENSECTAGIIISETESEVIFDWSDADVTDGYIISLTNLTTGQEQLFESDSSSLPIRMLRGTPYRWHVDTFLNDSQEVVSSDIEAFYNAGPGVQSFIPFPATAIFPKNGELINTNEDALTLQWEASDLDNDISEYDIYFGIENEPPLLSSGLQTNSLANVPVDSGEIYFWRVVTRDTQGNESNSELFSFEVSN
jgi:hypothetical protein